MADKEEKLERRKDVCVIKGTYYRFVDPLDADGNPQEASFKDGWIEEGYILDGMNGFFYVADIEFDDAHQLPASVTTREQVIEFLWCAGRWYQMGHRLGDHHKASAIARAYRNLKQEIWGDL